MSLAEKTWFAGHSQAILTEIYIEALLVDEELADQVCEAWDSARGLPGVGPDSWTVLVIYIASLFAYCQLR